MEKPSKFRRSDLFENKKIAFFVAVPFEVDGRLLYSTTYLHDPIEIVGQHRIELSKYLLVVFIIVL